MRISIALAVAASLAFTALAQAAPAVSGPDALPNLAAGVVGSGDQLSLQLRAADGVAARTLRIGDIFQDGWVLTGLSPSTATLTKAGASRTVGLNPSGAVVAAPGGQATVVTVTPDLKAAAARARQSMIDAQAEADRLRAVAAAANPADKAAASAAAIAASNKALTATNNAIRAGALAIGADPSSQGADFFDGVVRPPLTPEARQAAMDASQATMAAMLAQTAAIQARLAGGGGPSSAPPLAR